MTDGNRSSAGQGPRASLRSRHGAAVIVATTLAAAPAPAQAQDAPVTDVEVPVVVIDQGETQGPGADEALDLANIVQSAAKGVTTVQEAPAIVTVITADEIRDRQFQDLEQLIDTVPGWQRAGIFHSTFPVSLVRGQVQAVQFLHDGVSLFDPFVNVPSVSRVQPMELIKRVEVITGPGGVLWGSNSLLGILNLITKDAEDVDGIEVGGQVGDGGGDRLTARAYAMAGAPNLLGGKLKLFAHASVQTWQGPAFEQPLLLFHNALPQPNSPNQYGPLTESDPAQSMVVTLDGKLTYGKLQLRVYAPFGHKYTPTGLSGEPVRENLPQDPQCPVGTTDAGCVDPLRRSRRNREDVYDRYAVAEYRTRLAHDKAGFAARGYLQQFVRGFEPLQVLSPSPLVRGGLSFKADLTSYRAGGAFDGDVELSPAIRVLYGAEAFHEWKPDGATGSLQGDGTPFQLTAPYDPAQVPLPCPRDAAGTPVAGCPLTFAFPANRTVLGAYVDPQYRPNKRLIFDLGGRVQVAPSALGLLSYDLNTTIAATVVWNFIPSWHLKINYAQGFRPPVFNNTTSNGEAVQIGGNPNLAVETSDATQAEINARIFKGDRRIRELSFRIDGSYTRLNNLIQVSSGNYSNSGERALTSLEFLGKLYLQGGHRLELGYTYLRGDTSDKGRLRALPENWFSLAGVWSLIGSKLTATTTFKVTGAAEDPNRLVEYRDSTYTACTGSDPACRPGLVSNAATVLATDLVLDRLPPMAELSLGLTYAPTPKLAIRASAYNALLGHAYQPDVFFDYEPHLEYLPNPYEGFRAYLSMTYQY